MAEVKEKLVDAAKAFLKQKGYEWIDEGPFDMVALDHNTIVMIKVRQVEEFDDDVAITRKEFENLAANWLAEHEEYVNRNVRYDEIQFRILKDHLAMCKHWVGVSESEGF